MNNNTLGERLRKVRGAQSREAFSSQFFIHRNTLAAWEKGSTAPDGHFLRDLCERYALNPAWLLLGQGPQKVQETAAEDYPFSLNHNEEAYPNTRAGSPVFPHTLASSLEGIPVFGLSRSEHDAWFERSQTAITAQRPAEYHANPHVFVVIASEHHLLPEGIKHGYLCYCDPHCSPSLGDVVYVERVNGKVALRLLALSKGNCLTLHCWQNPDDAGRQALFAEELDFEEIKQLATVVYVKRRL